MESILITGVSSGIGLALAAAYLKRGETVYGVSRRQPPVELLNNSNFHFRSADLAELEKIPGVLRPWLRELRALDLVILNAGTLGPIADLEETSVSEMKRVMDVNVWANKVVLDSIQGSRIVLRQVVAISSGAAESPSRGFAAYGISKAALNMLIGSYAIEAREVHFTAMAPGLVDTAMQAEVANVADDRFPAIQILRAARGTSRMPGPAAIADRLIEGFEKARKYPSGSFLAWDAFSGISELGL